MKPSKPYIIGLTGGIGTGKSEAAKFLETLGAVQVDADEISHELTAPGAEALSEIREAFGDGVFDPDGALNRRELARVAFEDPANRRKLEAILHPRVQREMMRRIDLAAEENVKVVFLNVPLLFETGVDALCDETWVLLANPETQVARVMMRDRVEREDVEIRIVNQMSNEEKAERATVVLSTDRPIEKTQAELASLYQQVLKKL
ncbi:MAG: dephospho-CoA kinase [Clostridiales bacterium]|nr:dephospho-CoA kinase [Clostridiales bacterium]